MKHLELHILQSFPVSCMNRDELNSPKTAIFGGVQRARQSSQSWKRPTRMLARELLPEFFKGNRSRYIIGPLQSKFAILGQLEQEASASAAALAAALATADTANRTKTLFYATDGELAELAEIYSQAATPAARKKGIEKLLKATPHDAADLALFGRMVAADYAVKLDGAAMFSHAISTHKVENEIDFFAAVDDMPSSDEPGAAHTSTLEFNAATFYRFIGLNLDMLFDKDHLSALAAEERRSVVKAFVSAALQAYPTARHNSMHATTLPGFVWGIIREKGHPIQLVNAFERPIRPFGAKGLFQSSVEAMLSEHDRINSTWGLDKNETWKRAIVGSDYPLDKKDDDSSRDKGPKQVASIPAQDLQFFLEGLGEHAC
jgi:CRISPR system Cascade subunit CasC